MYLANYNQSELTAELIKRVNEITWRERIVIRMPYGCSIDRIEIYCSETSVNASPYSGTPFPGIVTLQQFNDIGNKSAFKSSYSYKSEFLNYLPKMAEKLYQFADSQLSN